MYRSGLYWVTIGLLASANSPAVAQDMCLACHSNHDFMLSTTGDSTMAERLHVHPDLFAESVHGQLGFSCTACHGGLTGYPHGEVAPVDCGGCHAAAGEQLAQSIHGQRHPETGEAAATCADCHTDHHILRPSDPESSVYRLTQFEICATCHEDVEKMRRFGQDNVETVSSYVSSVHGVGLLEKGLSVAPVCTDCHGVGGDGAHAILAVADSSCPMNWCQVSQRCGECHAGIMARYERSIHGETFRQGNPDAPTCVNCHAEHGVAAITSPESRVSPGHVAQTCTACHDREEFNQKYGVAVDRGRSFEASFHGIALEGGQLTVANCESCHGSHEILPSSDPDSRTHSANLVQTCGQCHAGIGEGVARGKIHVVSFVEENRVLGLTVQVFYIAVIGITVLYAFGLIFVDQYRHWIVDPRRHAKRDA
jgi:hypothetical protein